MRVSAGDPVTRFEVMRRHGLREPDRIGARQGHLVEAGVTTNPNWKVLESVENRVDHVRF